MEITRARLAALALAAGFAVVLARCGGGGGGGLDNEGPVSELDIEGVSGSTLDLNVGVSAVVAVEAFDTQGHEIEDAPITASSSNTAVATVTQGASASRVRLATLDFTIRGVGPGEASITFRHESSGTTRDLPVRVNAAPPPTPPPPPPPPPGGGRTVMTGNGNQTFSPASITITRGMRVDWIWNDPATHTVTSNPGQADSWDSGFRSGTGTQFSHTFNTAGTFSYVCRVHAPGMAGTITVTP